MTTNKGELMILWTFWYVSIFTLLLACATKAISAWQMVVSQLKVSYCVQSPIHSLCQVASNNLSCLLNRFLPYLDSNPLFAPFSLPPLFISLPFAFPNILPTWLPFEIFSFMPIGRSHQLNFNRCWLLSLLYRLGDNTEGPSPPEWPPLFRVSHPGSPFKIVAKKRGPDVIPKRRLPGSGALCLIE